MAARLPESVLPEPVLPAAFAADLLRRVAWAFDVALDEITGCSRSAPVMRARQAAIWLLRMRPKPGQMVDSGQPRRRSLPEVGRLIRADGLPPMDHSAVGYAVDKAADLAQRDPAFAALLPIAASQRPAPPRYADDAARQRRQWRAEVDAVLTAHCARRPSMALEADDTDAAERASGSMKLTAALAAARVGVAA